MVAIYERWALGAAMLPDRLLHVVVENNRRNMGRKDRA